MYKSKILGTGKFHPEKVMTNFDLEEMLDTSDQWITERTGIKERRISDPNKEEFPSAMAEYATKIALKEAGLEPNDIDYILFSITYSERSFPNTAASLQKRLGMTNKSPCLDINAACTGWAYGFELADTLIQSGKYKKILLVGCDQSTSFLNYDDRNTAILFGDGCGVVILGQESADSKSEIMATSLACDAEHVEALTLETGGILNPFTKENIGDSDFPQRMFMDGKIIFKNAVRTMASLSVEVLEKSNLTIDDVDWFIPHQANMRIVEAVAKRLEYPLDKVITNIAKYGNTSSATIPSALHEAIVEGKIKRGDKVLIASFGAGLTSAASIFVY